MAPKTPGLVKKSQYVRANHSPATGTPILVRPLQQAIIITAFHTGSLGSLRPCLKKLNGFLRELAHFCWRSGTTYGVSNTRPFRPFFRYREWTISCAAEASE